MGDDDTGPFLVKLRGIPYETTPGEVLEFLGDTNVKGGADGVHVLQAPDNRPKGEALVELETHQDMVNALNKDRQHMGNRYVEVMFVNKEQYDEEMTRQPGSVSDPPLCLCVCVCAEFFFFSGGAFNPLGIDSPSPTPLPRHYMFTPS